MGCQSITGLPPALNLPVPIYTPGWREACVLPKNTMSPARAQTQTARSRNEGTNHEATTPSPLTRYLLDRELVAKYVESAHFN